MAQDLTLGRAGLATASGGDGLVLKCAEWSQEGDGATISGIIRGRGDYTTIADLKAIRDQLQGYGPDNTDEPVVPVTWAQDASRDGFYRVQSVEVGQEATGRPLTNAEVSALAIPWRADLLRVPGWQAPLFEMTLTGAIRTNSHSILAATTLPSVGLDVGATTIASPLSTVTVQTGADGAQPILHEVTLGTGALTGGVGTFTWTTTPASYMKGAARIEVSYDSGSTWRTVVGRQIPNLPTYWRVSNGLARATATTTANKTELSVERYDGSQWETAKVWQITGSGSTTAAAIAPTSVTVNVNAPDMVSVRAALTSGASALSYQYLDVTLRRGSPNIECLYCSPALAGTFGVRRGTNEAATALSTTCGLRATSDDAGGNKYVVATPRALDATDTTIGYIRAASSTTFPFMLGLAVGGGVGTTRVQTMGQALIYMAAVTHTQRIVAR